jgi:murein L,D-transpeptidase YcbB/YkuD
MLSLYGDYPLQKSLLLEWFADDTPLTEEQTQTLDAPLVASLEQFQQRHGMQANGKLDKKTRELLNVPPLQRIRQIALNMKRWRELPANLGDRYLWVNMTDYTLQLMNHGVRELEMKVIIGKTYRKTPALKESISTLVLNPSWNVPRRIGLYDILPQARKDQSYLTTRNIRVLESWSNPVEVPIDTIDWKNATARNFKYRFKQAPGDNNALGSVKFVIPNDMSIYLHDTSHPELFARHKRALSSGCVRVEKPMQLARALLKGKKSWSSARIDSQMESGATQYVKLPKPVPTYLAYLTAWVDKNQLIQFRDDVYKRDQIVSDTARPSIEL